jgi:hypothetical protein
VAASSLFLPRGSAEPVPSGALEQIAHKGSGGAPPRATRATGKARRTSGLLRVPMVDLFTGGTMLPLMFMNAAATCYLLSLTAPLAIMEAWTKALERHRSA